MYRVHAPSRLHFGLLGLSSGDKPEQAVRDFGGIGLMIEKPGVVVAVEAASAWSAAGPLAERALDYARQFTRSLSLPTPPSFHIAVECCAPEHVGLGTGTQLGLAVARGLAVALGHGDLAAPALAQSIGRGRRSAIGIHGFELGGLLVDGGKGPATAIAPLISRLDFPHNWRILLVLIPGTQGLHGSPESQAFAELHGRQPRTDTLCRLALLGILPAMAERDLPAFGEALYEFNRLVGEMFRPFQLGTYASEQGAAVVDFVRGQRVSAVGQTSWGPAIFAIVEKDRDDSLAECIREHFAFDPAQVIVTRGSNHGAKTYPSAKR